jgi:hypothetical protein
MKKVMSYTFAKPIPALLRTRINKQAHLQSQRYALALKAAMLARVRTEINAGRSFQELEKVVTDHDIAISAAN